MQTLHCKTAACFFAGILAAASLLRDAGTLTVRPVSAAEETEHIQCIMDEGGNLWNRDYKTWSSPVTSALVPLADGSWMRVQYGTPAEQELLIAYYDSDFELKERKHVELLLPEYGGFYAASDGNYYVISGSDYSDPSDPQPVYDIARYNAEWEMTAHVQKIDRDVTKAFYCGTLRCEDDGKRLIIHTCREVPAGHQVNDTLVLDMERMELAEHTYRTDARVSHSFNQFVLTDGNDTVMLDHGDCYPRAVVLNRIMESGEHESVEMVHYFPAEDRELSSLMMMNYTGVDVGGFAQSSTHYLVAYNTINQDNWRKLATYYKYLVSETARNVMIAAVPKDDLRPESVTNTAVTAFGDAEETCSNPFLVPVAEDLFLLMWEHAEKVNYVFLDGSGAVTGEQYEMDAALSDCEPVVAGDKVYWYTWDDADLRFYSIDIEHPEQTEAIRRIAGHDYHLTAEPDADGYVYDICSRCGDTIAYVAPTDYRLGIRRIQRSDSSSTGTVVATDTQYLDAGDELEYFVSKIKPAEYDRDTGVFYAEITEGSEYLTYNSKTATYFIRDFDEDSISFVLKVWPRENPALEKEVRVRAKHSYEIKEIREPDDTQDGCIILECTGCGHTVTYSMNGLAARNGETAAIAPEANSFEYDHSAHEPAVTVTLMDPETGETTVLAQGTEYTVCYVNNTDSGTAYALIRATENSTKLTGSAVIPFTITPQQLSECTWTYINRALDAEDPETDLQEALTPEIILWDKQKKRVPEDAVYTRGTYHLTDDGKHIQSLEFIIHAHAQNYVNSKTVIYPVPLIRIQPYEAAFTDPEVAESGSLTYTGEPLEPEVIVKSPKGRILRRDTDYSVTYQNNTACGTAEVIIEGLMCYTGTILLEFMIKGEEQETVSGDADGDGALTEKDAEMLSGWLSGDPDAALTDWQASDMNADQRLNAVDLTLMKRAAAAKETASLRDDG